jgi:hypothetical protein
MTKLSHSAKDKIITCGALYKFHYIEKLRPNTTSSALFYGKALDEAFTALLLTKLITPPKEIPCPYETFKKFFTTVDINGDIVPVIDIRCKYTKGDLDPDLCSDPSRANFLLNNKKELTDEMLVEYNKFAVESLTNKAALLIDAYKLYVMPYIDKVYTIQEEVNLPNDEGDTITGFIDFTCSFVGDPAIYIVDNKTSSKNYKEDSVRTSEQLATYCDYKLTNKAAFIVLNKVLKKKAPKVGVQIIKDTIPDEMFEKVFDTYQKALYTIREEDYSKNFDSGCFFFGQRCAYFSKCRTGSEEGLVKLKGDTDGKSRNNEKR